jgi:predicted enzyme related to lactoylglutathione lyase
MNTPAHAINWFEIPVVNFERAKLFYEALFGYQMPVTDRGSVRMGFFLYDFKNGGRGGAIVYNPDFYQPSEGGSLIYLNCEPDLQPILNKVEAAGGQVIKEKTVISPDQNLGFWALIKDTEGNRVALHSMH